MTATRLVYFHIDEYSRDSIVASALRKEFQILGYKFVYGSRTTQKILSKYESAFEIVILPRPEFISTIFGSRDRSTLSAKYFILYTENIGLVASKKYPEIVLKTCLDERFMSGDSRDVDLISGFFLWGESSRKIINKKFHFLAEKLFVCGHPRHDSRCLPSIKSIATTVGVISRHSQLNDYYGRSPLSSIVKRYAKSSDLYEYINSSTDEYIPHRRRGAFPEIDVVYEANDAKKISIIIRKLIENGFRVSFKVHPRENVNEWRDALRIFGDNVEFADPSLPFTHWANEQIAVIGPQSTAAYDCRMLGKIFIPINFIDKFNCENKILTEADNLLSEFIHSPVSYDELINLVIDHSASRECKAQEQKVLAEEADFPECIDSCKKITSIINQCCNQIMNSPRSYQRVSYYYMFVIEKLIQYNIFLVKRNILKLFGRKLFINSASFYLGPSIEKKINLLAND